VSVALSAKRHDVFSVLGEVTRPGTYAIGRKDMRLLEALAIAGGITRANLRYVYVIRRTEAAGGPATRPAAQVRIIAVDLQKLTDGDPRMNVVLRRKDVISVPKPVSGEFYVFGEVARPGVYSLTGRRITVKQALAAAGTVGPSQWPEKAVLIRRVGDAQERVLPLNIRAIFKGEEPDLFVKPNDVLAVGIGVKAASITDIRKQVPNRAAPGPQPKD